MTNLSRRDFMKVAGIGAFAAALLAACGTTEETAEPAAEETTAEETAAEETAVEEAPAEEAPAEEVKDGFDIYYPSAMVETYGESLHLEAVPEKIACLSDGALQVLVRCDVKPIAITSLASSATYPDWVNELPVITTGMNDMDTEAVIAMEPDLVILGKHLQESYGSLLEDAGIPVYYTSNGPSVTYTEVKEEAMALMQSFGDEEAQKALQQEFDDLEARAAQMCSSMETRTCMILFSFPPTYQQTSLGYLGSMVAQLPFEILSDSLVDPEERTTPLDTEKLVELNPEVLFAISPATGAEDLEASYAQEMKDNAGVWDNLQAAQNGNIFYLSSEYVSSKGLYMITSMNSLMDMIEEKFN